MKLITIEWLKEQSQNTKVNPEIREDLRLFLAKPNGTTATEYLKPREAFVDVTVTDGKWNRKVHEQKFSSHVDGDFENYSAVGRGDKATSAIKALPHDLVKDGSYMQIIADKPENFFQNATQALQVAYDNPALVEEVLQKDRRLHLPFVNERGVKFVACVSKKGGQLNVGVSKISGGGVWLTSFGNVFIFPQQVV